MTPQSTCPGTAPRLHCPRCHRAGEAVQFAATALGRLCPCGSTLERERDWLERRAMEAAFARP